MSNSVDTHEGEPPLDPGVEEILPSDSAITEVCLTKLKQGFAGLLDRISFVGGPLLSRSQTWGIVWRADFTFAERHPTNGINRVVCWRLPDDQTGLMVAVGQQLKPLSDKD